MPESNKKEIIKRKCPVCAKQSVIFDELYLTCTNCRTYRKRVPLYQRALMWAEGKWWIIRIPFYIWFIVLFVQLLSDSNPPLLKQNPLGLLNFGVHELGHFLFIALGDFMTVLGGSLLQILFAVLTLLACIQQRWYFAAALCFCFIGMNFYDVAVYVADARARELPLVSPAFIGVSSDQASDIYDQVHDWYNILGRLGYLELDTTIARWMRGIGAISFITGFLLGGRLLVQMMITNVRQVQEYIKKDAA